MFGIPLWALLIPVVLGAFGSGSGGSIGSAPAEGASTNKSDGTVHKVSDGVFLFACAGKWWLAQRGGICCRAMSGRTFTLSDGRQVVCGYDDETASYRLLGVPEQR